MKKCNDQSFKSYIEENNIVNPWEHVAALAEKSGSYFDRNVSYICECDESIIKEYNNSPKRHQNHQFATTVMPVPFEGNVFEAKIIILTLNPGFIEDVNCTLYELFNDDKKKQITDYHIQNLRLQCKDINTIDAVRFIGDRYWHNKTKELREDHGFKPSEIAIIQYIGYQSKEFYETSELMRLKSIDFTKQLIKYIVNNRTDDDYCFVIARGEKKWMDIFEEMGLDSKLEKKIIILKNKRNTTISQNNIDNSSWSVIKGFKSK